MVDRRKTPNAPRVGMEPLKSGLIRVRGSQGMALSMDRRSGRFPDRPWLVLRRPPPEVGMRAIVR